MNIDLKNATNDNIPIILEMMEEFYAHENIPFMREKSMATLVDFLSRKETGKIWVIYADNDPAGYCCLVNGYTLEYHGPDCFLDEIFIKPHYQNKGIGTKVLDLLSDFAAQNGITAIHLFVFDENTRAYNLYMRNGFIKRKGSLMVKLLGDKQV